MIIFTVAPCFLEAGDQVSVTIPDKRKWKLWLYKLFGRTPPKQIKYYEIVSRLNISQVEAKEIAALQRTKAPYLGQLPTQH
jgi:hypothetical protein